MIIKVFKNEFIFLGLLVILLAGTVFAAEDEFSIDSYRRYIPIAIGIIVYLISRKKKQKLDTSGEEKPKIKPKTFSTSVRDPIGHDNQVQQRLEKQYDPIEPK